MIVTISVLKTYPKCLQPRPVLSQNQNQLKIYRHPKQRTKKILKAAKEKSSATQDQPGPSGVVKLRKRSGSSQKTQESLPSSSSIKGKKASTKDNHTQSAKKLRSVSESNVAEASTSNKKNATLKKSKSDSGVETKKRGKKRKAKATHIFSPKKLRSSSNPSNSQGVKPQAKTGTRSSRERNPPEVDEPSGDSSNKLGSCASRR